MSSLFEMMGLWHPTERTSARAANICLIHACTMEEKLGLGPGTMHVLRTFKKILRTTVPTARRPCSPLPSEYPQDAEDFKRDYPFWYARAYVQGPPCVGQLSLHDRARLAPQRVRQLRGSGCLEDRGSSSHMLRNFCAMFSGGLADAPRRSLSGDIPLTMLVGAGRGATPTRSEPAQPALLDGAVGGSAPAPEPVPPTLPVAEVGSEAMGAVTDMLAALSGRMEAGGLSETESGSTDDEKEKPKKTTTPMKDKKAMKAKPKKETPMKTKETKTKKATPKKTEPAEKNPKRLQYPGLRASAPKLYGCSTIYTDISKGYWRLKLAKGDKHEKWYPMNQASWRSMMRSCEEANRGEA